jgi:hypothetical protein
MEQLCIGNFGLATETIPLFACKNCAKCQILLLLSMGRLTQACEPPDGEPIGEGLFSVLLIPTGQVIRKKVKAQQARPFLDVQKTNIQSTKVRFYFWL